jgi:hypothetical protein
MRIKFYLEILRGRDHLNDLGIDSRIIQICSIKSVLQDIDMKVCIGFIWLRTGTSVGHF